MFSITGFVNSNPGIGSKLADSIALHSLFYTDEHNSLLKEHPDYTVGLAYKQVGNISQKKRDKLMESSCGQYALTLCGTIYNATELRETLIKYGISFRTLSDAEVLLEGYKKWGQKLFDKIDGSFAFILWDKNLNQVMAGRDSIGAKPLFYFKKDRFYAYSSEIRSLLHFSFFEKHINHNALANFFRYGYFPDDETIYEQIFQFKAGTITVIDLFSGNSYEKLIKPDTGTHALPEKENELIKRAEELLTEAILKRNPADSPAGILLTTGYESATMAALLQRNLSKRIKTYSLAFEGNPYNEIEKTKKIAELLKTNHREIWFKQKEAGRILEKLPAIFEIPMGDSSVLSSLFIAESLQNEVQVLLGSEGGDVLFGGYRSYQRAVYFDKIANRLHPFAFNLYTGLLRYTSPKLRETMTSPSLLEMYQSLNACFTRTETARLLNYPGLSFVDDNKENSKLKDLMAYDFRHYLPNNLLYKNNKCLQSYGIENHDGFLTADLVYFLNLLDEHWFIRKGENKFLIRKILYQYIPPQLIDPAKKGLSIPLIEWLKTCFKPYITYYLSPEQLSKHQLLNTTEVLRIKSAFYKKENIDYAKKLWLLLQFQMWYNEWID